MYYEILIKKGTQFRLYAMPIAVGIYLPLSLAIPIFAGGIIELIIRNQINKNRRYWRTL